MRRSPLRRVSKKQAARNQIYSKLRKAYLTEHPICGICMDSPATTIHHKGLAGQMKRGSNTNNTDTWLQLCMPCHQYLEAHKDWARENGYLT